MLFVSHNMAEVVEVATRVAVLKSGRKIADRAATGLSADDLAHLIAQQQFGSDILDQQAVAGVHLGSGAEVHVVAAQFRVGLHIADREDLNVLGMNYLSTLERWGVEGRWLILQS